MVPKPKEFLINNKVTVNGEAEDRRGRKLYPDYEIEVLGEKIQGRINMFRLKQIKISNFRCYESLTQEFSPNINIIIGDNAVGKTSLIESVYALGVTKSHKASSDLEMIRHNADFVL